LFNGQQNKHIISAFNSLFKFRWNITMKPNASNTAEERSDESSQLADGRARAC